MSKNQLTILAASAAIIFSVAGTAALTAGTLAKTNTTSSASSITTDEVSTLLDETVYVFTDATGKPRRVISSDWTKTTLDTDKYTKVEKSDTSTPIDIKVSYTLNGQPISAEDLAGKSGQVEIKFTYTNTAKENGYYLPYAVITGLVLDNDNFKNVTVEGGRIANDGSRTLVAGAFLPGLQENLGTSLDLPSSLKITADVKDFKLGMTVSLASTSIFSDLDPSNFSSLDNIESELSKLSDAMGQLLDGSSKLYDGLAELNDKSGALVEGINALTAGAAKLSAGATELSTELSAGAISIETYNSSIIAALDQIIDGYLAGVNANVPGLDISAATYSDPTKNSTYASAAEANATIASIKQYTDYLYTFRDGLVTYTDTVAAKISDAAAGATQLSAGATSLTSGLTELNNSAPSLIAGITELKNGSGELNSGLNTFNEQGVNQLISAYNNNFKGLSKKLTSIVDLAKSHQNVKYFYRTDEIK